MEPRALKRILQLGPRNLRETIAEGLGLIAENVAALGDDIESLAEAGGSRGLWVLSGQADEEAAKALILLDIARSDQRDHVAILRQIRHFYDHLARRIYIEMAHMNPADYAEIRRLVEVMRPSHFLDGPNEIDWIYRNQLLAQREEGLYVDYLHDDEGDRWVTPAKSEELHFAGPSDRIRNLLGALHRLGITSAGGLEVIADVWAGEEMVDATHGQEVLRLNRLVLTELIDRDIVTDLADQADVDLVGGEWGFPLGGLNLTELEIPRADLESERESRAPDM